MLRFMPSPVFSFNEQLLAALNHEGSCNDMPYKRVFVNIIEDGLAFNTMARFKEITVRHIKGGLARVTYVNNATKDAVITYKDYDRKDLKQITDEIIGFLEDSFDPSVIEEVV